ncbi:Fic/DOC family protein [uncultured archaeon]|nr:Fic/DOC family protein [uncultured archaeon]
MTTKKQDAKAGVAGYDTSRWDEMDTATIELLLRRNYQEQLPPIIEDPYGRRLSDDEKSLLGALEPSGKQLKTHLTEREWSRFTAAFVYDTNAIEGSQLSRQDVESALEGRQLRGRHIDDVSEAVGLAGAFAEVRRTEEHFSPDLIRKLHLITFKKSKSFAGEFRTEGVSVVDTRTGEVVYEGASPRQIVPRLKKLEKWYLANRANCPPVTLAAVVHNRFEMIHPFEDGNGRVGRLLLNNVLMKNGATPVNVELKRRKEYYSALEAYERTGDILPTVRFILDEQKRLPIVLSSESQSM